MEGKETPLEFWYSVEMLRLLILVVKVLEFVSATTKGLTVCSVKYQLKGWPTSLVGGENLKTLSTILESLDTVPLLWLKETRR